MYRLYFHVSKQPTPFIGTESQSYHPRSALETEDGAKWICAMSDSSYPRTLEMVQDGTLNYSINIPYGPIRTQAQT
jgi:hypothetical protein